MENTDIINNDNNVSTQTEEKVKKNINRSTT